MSLPGPITAADIETVFRTALPGGGRVRKRLHAKDFPHAFERGLWSAKAMVDWLVSAGRAESHVFSMCDWFPQFIHSVDRGRAAQQTLASLKPRSSGNWRARRDSNS